MDPQYDIEAAEEFEVDVTEPYGSEEEDVTENVPNETVTTETPTFEIKAPIKGFLENFRNAIMNKNTTAIQSAYDNSWNNFTSKFFKSQRWPSPDIVSSHFQNDTLFVILYKELYYRHVYSRLSPTIQDRYESYKNYCDLFNLILSLFSFFFSFLFFFSLFSFLFFLFSFFFFLFSFFSF